ncbi:MAG: YkgJ family cysteine cluster protein [Desulfobacteraceae bacterium]|nr:YkgJ family cysteine cluster protein [Desulfobacteraceae bacterium]
MQPLFEAGENLLSESSSFHFACHDALPCFTQCCRDVNIYLTPYDIVRLRRVVKTGSTEFLARHTQSFLAKGTSIPVVQLLMDPKSLYCPFVTADGCQVYENRPWACRMFPLDLSPTPGQYRLIAGKDRCKGLLERRDKNVGDWMNEQGVSDYVAFDAEFQSVMPKRFRPGAPMNEGLGRVLFLAYDLDRFKELLSDARFKRFYEVDDAMIERALENDEELLRLAFRYIREQMDELYQVL